MRCECGKEMHVIGGGQTTLERQTYYHCDCGKTHIETVKKDPPELAPTVVL